MLGKLNTNFIKALVRRDLRRYFSIPTGYVFITLFIFLSAAAAFWQERFFASNLANLEQLNQLFPILLLFFVPALTMSVWSDERKQATDELLFTMPATSLEVVLGKYISTVGIYTVSLLLSVSHVLVLFWLGSPDIGLLFSNYVGYWFFGAAMISVGLLGSLLSANAAIAYILGALFSAILLYIDGFFGTFSVTVEESAASLTAVPYFLDFAGGVISLKSVLYFLSVSGLMIYLNMLIVDRRHWPQQLEGRPTWQHQLVRVVAVIVSIVCLNAIIGRAGVRLDVTAEQLHSLSGETKGLIQELSDERPVFVQAFISPEVPEPFVQTRANLLSVLSEIDAVGGSGVEVLIRDTMPYSAEAKDARERFGIMPRQIPNLGSARAGFSEVFLGIAFTCGAEEEVIPFLDRGLSPEYEIARSIRVVARTQRKKIGVYQTAINLFGGFDFQSMRSSPSWGVVDELKKQYEVVQVSPTGEMPEDLDGLLVALPSTLPQEQMDALAEVIQSGVPTLLLIDPLPLVNISLAPSEQPGANQNPLMRNQGPPPTPKGDVEGFLSKVGVSWDSARVVWDSYNPHPDLASLPPEIVFVGRGNGNPEAFNPSELSSGDLQELVLMYPGDLVKSVDTKYDFRPLLQTGRGSGHFAYPQLIQRSFFGVQMNRNLPHRPTEMLYTMAARVTSAAGTGTSETEPKEEGVDETPAVKPLDVIVVADIDFISEQFFQIRAQGPQDLNFDNVTFFLNCMDVLVGDPSFITLRNKRVRHRTLERVEEQTRKFIEQRVQEEQQAETDAELALNEAQRRLDEKVNAITERPDLDSRTKQIMARNLQEAENRRLDVLKANIETEKEAKIHASKENMEDSIRGIQSGLRTLAVLLPPIPVFILGVLIFVRRQKREREGAAAVRRLRA